MRAEWSFFGMAVAIAGSSAATCAAPFDPSAPIRTPYARHEALGIRKITIAPQSVPAFERIEITVEAGATFDNPFDSGDVALDARIVAPSKKVYDVPGYFHQGYRRELKGRREVLTPIGKPAWKIRYCPSEPGAHQFSLRLRDRSGTAAAPSRRFTVTPGKSPGLIRVSPRDRRYFAFDSGKAYFPLGANIPAAGWRGTFDYDDWLPSLAKSGGNYARLSLAPDSPTFALERVGKTEEGLGIGQFDPANAWRVDRVLETARRNGLYLMLTLEASSSLSSRWSLAPQWSTAPHNAQNGGPLSRPQEYWRSEAMLGLYKNKLRYVVARYGASPHVFAWELWNAPDTTDSYHSDQARDWFKEVTNELQKLDPYRHLITTSFARHEGDRAVASLDDLSFVQTQALGASDAATAVADAQSQQVRHGKPHYVGDTAANIWTDRSDYDPNGLQVHDPLWASIALAASGAAQPRWWSGYLAPRRLFTLFTPAARFTADIDWPAERFKPTSSRAEWLKRPATLPRTDLAIDTTDGTWTASEINRPRSVLVNRSGATGQVPVASLLHGVHTRSEFHNPVTFQTTLPWATRFEVQVRGVSGEGGGALRIMLDGKNVLERDFVDRDPSLQPDQRYAGIYGVDVPAGSHTLQVANVGQDWLEAGYFFRDAVERTGPPLQVWSAAGRSTALAWARPAGRTWHRVCELKRPVSPTPPCTLLLPGLTPGKWQAELWDTWSGRVVGRQAVTVARSGTARLALPKIERDLAVKLRREGTDIRTPGR